MESPRSADGFVLHYVRTDTDEICTSTYAPEDGYGSSDICFRSLLSRIAYGLEWKIEIPIKLCTGAGEVLYNEQQLRALVADS